MKPRRFVRGPKISRLETPYAQPFMGKIAIDAEAISAEFRTEEKTTRHECNRFFGMIGEEAMHGLDLRDRPQFVRIDLPKKNRFTHRGQRRADHLALAVPEFAVWFSIHGDLLWKFSSELVQILTGSIHAAAIAMKFRRNMTSRAHAPGRIVLQFGHAFDNVPMPRQRQPAKNFNVVANERLAVEDNRKKMQRQRRCHLIRFRLGRVVPPYLGL